MYFANLQIKEPLSHFSVLSIIPVCVSVCVWAIIHMAQSVSLKGDSAPPTERTTDEEHWQPGLEPLLLINESYSVKQGEGRKETLVFN